MRWKEGSKHDKTVLTWYLRTTLVVVCVVRRTSLPVIVLLAKARSRTTGVFAGFILTVGGEDRMGEVEEEKSFRRVNKGIQRESGNKRG